MHNEYFECSREKKKLLFAVRHNTSRNKKWKIHTSTQLADPNLKSELIDQRIHRRPDRSVLSGRRKVYRRWKMEKIAIVKSIVRAGIWIRIASQSVRRSTNGATRAQNWLVASWASGMAIIPLGNAHRRLQPLIKGDHQHDQEWQIERATMRAASAKRQVSP